MSSKAQYIAKHINILNIEDRYTVAKILLFRDCKLLQSNNGAYIHLKDIDEETMEEVYNFLKTKLSSQKGV
jgi:hypothetical protein